MSSIYDWSTIAGDNGNSDAAINWAEGQPPSTVNNSARAMMQRVKELLNDLGGITTVTGTANSLSLAASSAFTSYEDGLRVSFRALVANSAATTLNVNGVGSKPLVKFTADGEVALSGGELQIGCIYEAFYSEALNGAAGAWLLLNPTALSTFPPGLGAPFFGTSAPTGWLSCNGAAVSRTTYADLFAAVSTTWGVGDGSTTFNLPDGRDDFLRGASGTLAVGTRQTDMLEAHTHTITVNAGGAHAHTVPKGNSGGGDGVQNGPISGGSVDTSTAAAHTHTASAASTGGTETRPRNIVVLWIIKT